MLYSCLRPLLFKLSPEKAHDWALKGLRWYPTLSQPTGKPVSVMGLTFPNAVGLAAGLDKNGAYSKHLFKLGFGFVEIGTLTPKPQPGNPQPRLFRLVKDQAIINRMGFNNNGVEVFLQNHARDKRSGILGVNIGKNKTTPLKDAFMDYVEAFDKVYPYADYITANVSSPNTPGLRELEQGDFLKNLCAHLKQAQQKNQDKHQKYVPLVIKISPDLTDSQLDDTVKTLVHFNIDGVIATNTTLNRTLLKHPCPEQGGLSGSPLTQASLNIIRALNQRLQGQLPIIGVGGIMQAQHAKAKIEAGASLVQLYTGLIYHGPHLVHQSIKLLADLK